MAAPTSDERIARVVVKGQNIFSEGETAEFFYRVATGVVRTYTIQDDGRRLITGFYLKGDIFGLEAGSRHRFSASGLGDVTIVPFRRSALDTLLNSEPELRDEVLRSLISNVEHLQHQVLLLGRKTAREKIAQFLASLAHRASKGSTAGLQLRRSDIADYLGMSRETVSRTLSELSSDGVIEVGERS